MTYSGIIDGVDLWSYFPSLESPKFLPNLHWYQNLKKTFKNMTFNWITEILKLSIWYQECCYVVKCTEIHQLLSFGCGDQGLVPSVSIIWWLPMSNKYPEAIREILLFHIVWMFLILFLYKYVTLGLFFSMNRTNLNWTQAFARSPTLASSGVRENVHPTNKLECIGKLLSTLTG